MKYSAVWDQPTDSQGRGIRRIGDPSNVRLRVDLSDRSELAEFRIHNALLVAGHSAGWFGDSMPGRVTSPWIQLGSSKVWEAYATNPISPDEYVPGEYETYVEGGSPGHMFTAADYAYAVGFVIQAQAPVATAQQPLGLVSGGGNYDPGWVDGSDWVPPPVAPPPAVTPKLIPSPTDGGSTPAGSSGPATSFRNVWDAPTDSQGRGIRKVGQPSNAFLELRAPAGSSVTVVNEKVGGGTRVEASLKIGSAGVQTFQDRTPIPATYQPGEYTSAMLLSGVRYAGTGFVIEAGGTPPPEQPPVTPPTNGGGSPPGELPPGETPPGGVPPVSAGGGSAVLWLLAAGAGLLILARRKKP